MTSTAASIVGNVTTVVASVVAMFLLDWRLALFSLALLPFFVLLARRVGNQRRKITTVKQGAMADISSLVQESLSVSGILLGKTMGRSAELAERFEQRVGEPRRPRGPLADGRPLDDGRDPDVVRGDAGARLPVRRPRPGRGVDRHDRRLHHAADAALLPGPVAAVGGRRHPDLHRAVRPRLRVPRPDGRHRARARETLDDVRGEVRFDGVWFRYGDEWTLRDVDITVPAGTRTALVGETGAGKTSLGYLAARLYDPEQGAVRIDGTDLRELTFDALADAVGVVSQETYLFHASVRENLRFAQAGRHRRGDRGRRPRRPDPRQDRRAPDGYDTVVGERGFRFSGGEKQRIAIARTILRNPPVLVLDEATSALDVQTERAVGEALEQLAEGRTTIVIAHRLSTVRDADQIVVLDRGRGRRARHPRGAARARRRLRRPGRPRRRLPAKRRGPDLADRGGGDRPVLAAGARGPACAGSALQRGARSRARRPQPRPAPVAVHTMRPASRLSG